MLLQHCRNVDSTNQYSLNKNETEYRALFQLSVVPPPTDLINMQMNMTNNKNKDKHNFGIKTEDKNKSLSCCFFLRFMVKHQNADDYLVAAAKAVGQVTSMKS